MTAGNEVEAKASRPQAPGFRSTLLHILSVHGLLVFGILLVVVFALLLPATFTGSQNFRAILGNNTTVALLAMAEMIVDLVTQADSRQMARADQRLQSLHSDLAAQQCTSDQSVAQR